MERSGFGRTEGFAPVRTPDDAPEGSIATMRLTGVAERLQQVQAQAQQGQILREGMTLVPLALYFNDRGIAKIQIGLAKGRKKQDKRQAAKDRDWGRDKARLLRIRNL